MSGLSAGNDSSDGIAYFSTGQVNPGPLGGLVNVTSSNNGLSGFYDDAPGSAAVSGGSFNGSTQSSGSGIWFGPQDSGTISLTSTTALSNTDNGLFDNGEGALSVNTTGTFSSNGGNGIVLSGNVHQGVTLTKVVVDNNAMSGLAAATTSSLTITGPSAFNGNGMVGDQNGMYIYSPINGVSLSNVTANGNYGNGLYDHADGAQSIVASSFGAAGAGNQQTGASYHRGATPRSRSPLPVP